MDCDVPPRVAYWTSAFHPEMEAIAGEIAILRQRFRSSVAWGVSPNRTMQLSWRRGFGFHPRLFPVFRGATYFLQRMFAINHVFGSLGDWFHLKAVSGGPTVLTVAADSSHCDARMLAKVDRFVVEWPAAAQQLRRLGIEKERICTILPPVDLRRFQPSSRPSGPFTVLFASSPERADWLEGRGVNLLLEAAALRPQFVFRLLWRPWGDSLPAVRQFIHDRGLKNVDVRVGRVTDMTREYQSAHATVAPFMQADKCKPAPNSILESLACGRPVVVTDTVGIGDLINGGEAGLVCRTSPQALADALDRVAADWLRFSACARSLAERHFAVERFLDEYTRLYAAVA